MALTYREMFMWCLVSLSVLTTATALPEKSFWSHNLRENGVLRGTSAFSVPTKVNGLEGFSAISCHPTKPSFLQGMLVKAWDSGAYLLVMEVQCMNADCLMDITLDVEMRNPDGSYLSVVEFPFLPFNGIMSCCYFILVVIWIGLAIRYWHDLMRIQFCIAVVLILGLWEHLTLFAIYETLQRTGQVADSAVYFAEFVTCVQRTLARILVLIACLGYGVTKPRLGATWFHRCLLIGVVYFLLVTIEGMTRVSHPRFTTTYFRLATILPLLLLDVSIMWWIFIYLAKTLRETRMRRNLVKHRLYRNFSYLLLAVSLASLAFMVWSVSAFKYRPCIANWRMLWIDDAFWQFLFILIMSFIVILWRPTPLNRQYAYSLLDVPAENGGGDLDEDDDEEEILLDRINRDGNGMTELRSRKMDDEDDETYLEDDDQKRVLIPQVQDPVPASIVERMGMEAISGPNEQPPVWKVD